MEISAEESLKYYLDSLDLADAPASSLALLGDPFVGRSVLCGSSEKRGRSCAVIEVPMMPSKEEVWEYRRKEAEVANGRAELPSFFRAFLHLCGISAVPEILLLHRFNYVSAASSYHLKAMLDPLARGKDPYLEGLKCVAITIGKPGSADVFDMDTAVRQCLAAVVELDPSL